MLLALSIALLWGGAALLYVAFHPLRMESQKGAPGDVVESLRTGIANAGNAWSL